jgi:glycosyltransferase involved in cell wall biosynthesis
MKILIVAPSYPPTPGGVERHVQEMAEALVRRGHRVTVVALLEGLKPGPDRSGVADPGLHNRLRVIRIPMTRVGPFDLPRGLISRLRELAAANDVVHVHNYHSVLPMLTLRAVRDTPVVVNPHFHGGGHSPLASLVHPAYRAVFRALLPRAAALVFVSAAERAMFEQAFGAGQMPATVIHNGVRTAADDATAAAPESEQESASESAPADPDAPPLVVSVGRLEQYKRVDQLLHALPQVPGDWRCVVIGDGPDRGRLEVLAGELGPEVRDRIRFAGRVSDAELDATLARAAVAVTASEHESFGMAALDALAAGARVVASDIPSHREIAELSGGNLQLWDPAEGPGELARLIGSGFEAQADLGPAAVHLPTWDDAARAVEELYLNLTGSATRRGSQAAG